MKRCIACGRPIGANRTDEHVLAQWLLDDLGMRREDVFHGIGNNTTLSVEHTRIYVLDKFVQGNVCGSCNSGWMSRLEADVKPIIRPIVRGERPVFTLGDREREVVSRWTLKTSIVLTHAVMLKQPRGLDHIRHLYLHGTMPTDVGIFAMQYPRTERFSYFQRNSWINAAPPGTPPPPPETSYKVAFQVGDLLLLAAYPDIALAQFILCAGMHIPLWPLSDFYASHSKPLALNQELTSHGMLQIFNDGLGVLHTPAQILSVDKK